MKKKPVAEDYDMTPESIRQMISHIDVSDSEAAHGAEDEIWMETLQAIADGNASDPAECALAALETTHLSFRRHYAQ